MRISTRVQYGVRLMFQLALRYDQGYTFLKDIARREGLSEKYLSLIVIPLRTCGLLVSSRGARGGYMLARSPEQISIHEIVCALDGEIQVLRNARGRRKSNPYAACIAREVWHTLETVIEDTLTTITLETLVDAYTRSTTSALSYEI